MTTALRFGTDCPEYVERARLAFNLSLCRGLTETWATERASDGTPLRMIWRGPEACAWPPVYPLDLYREQTATRLGWEWRPEDNGPQSPGSGG